MRRRRLAVVVMVVGFLLISAVQPGRAAGKSDSIPLGAVTEVKGRSSQTFLVHLPADAAVSTRYGSLPEDDTLGSLPGWPFQLGPNPDVRFRGSGRLIAFFLVNADVEGSAGAAILGGRLAFCYETGCTSRHHQDFFLSRSVVTNDSGQFVLPAGNYRFYFIADGAPAQIVLMLHGLSGRVTLSGGRLVDAGIHEPPVHLSEEQTGSVYVAGEEVRASGAPLGFAALAFSAVLIEGMLTASDAVGVCWWDEGIPPGLPEVLAYGPACPEGYKGTRTFPQPLGFHTAFVMPFLVHSGTSGRGVWFDTASVVDAGHALTFFLELQ